MIFIGGDNYYDGQLVFGFLAPFSDKRGKNMWKPGVLVSPDGGLSWNPIEIIDIKSIPGMGAFDRLWDWNRENSSPDYSGDVAIGDDEKIHLVTGLSRLNDSADNEWVNALVEFYGGNGSWSVKFIVDSLDDNSKYSGPDTLIGGTVYSADPGMGKFGYNIQISSGFGYSDYTVQWLYHGAETENCDIYQSNRRSHSWEKSFNLTQTPYMNETAAFLAKRLGVWYHLETYSIYWYEAGAIGDINPLNPAAIFISSRDHGFFLPEETWLSTLIISSELDSLKLKTLYFGVRETASADLDQHLGEWQLPVDFPDNGEIDARFIIPRIDKTYSKVDIRHVNISSSDWELELKPGDSGYPITLEWESDKLGDGQFLLKNSSPSPIFVIDMKEDSAFIIQDTTIKKLKIEFRENPTLVESSGDKQAKSFYVAQNYPNPFNPSTIISFSIPAKEYVTLKVYSIPGEEVASLICEEMEAGKYEREFDASGLTSGVYIYSLTAGGYSYSRKMLLLK